MQHGRQVNRVQSRMGKFIHNELKEKGRAYCSASQRRNPQHAVRLTT